MALTVLERINKEMSSLCDHVLSGLTQKLMIQLAGLVHGLRGKQFAVQPPLQLNYFRVTVLAKGLESTTRGGCSRVVVMLLITQQTSAPGTLPGRNKTSFATNDTSRPWLTFCPPASPTWSPFKRLCGAQWCAPFFYTS